MVPVYLVVGATGSGKSWACRQVKDRFTYIPHDICWHHPSAKPDKDELDPKWGPPGSESIHLEVISEMAKTAKKPILTECPFAERQLRADMESAGIKVIPVFVVEDPRIVAKRYEAREGKPLPKAAYSRASTIINRAIDWNCFYGTSRAVLQYLQEVPLES